MNLHLLEHMDKIIQNTSLMIRNKREDLFYNSQKAQF